MPTFGSWSSSPDMRSAFTQLDPVEVIVGELHRRRETRVSYLSHDGAAHPVSRRTA